MSVRRKRRCFDPEIEFHSFVDVRVAVQDAHNANAIRSEQECLCSNPESSIRM